MGFADARVDCEPPPRITQMQIRLTEHHVITSTSKSYFYFTVIFLLVFGGEKVCASAGWSGDVCAKWTVFDKLLCFVKKLDCAA